MAQKIKIGDRTYPSKKAAKDFYKEILNQGEVDRELSSSEFGNLMDLLALHPRMDEKIGCGIDSFRIGYNSKYRNRNFIILRKNGTKEDFSYLKCIDGNHPPFTEFSQACRAASHDRLHAWKAEQMDGKEVKCAITGKLLNFEEAHVDHKPPLTFSVIAKSFQKANDIDLSKLSYTRKGILGVEFSDTSLAEEFDKFHAKMAVLRIVCAYENLKGSYAAKITPSKGDGILA